MPANDGVMVLICENTKKRSTRLTISHLPRTGDLIRLNRGLFKVDQVVFTFSQQESESEPKEHGLLVYVDELQDDESYDKYSYETIDHSEQVKFIGRMSD